MPPCRFLNKECLCLVPCGGRRGRKWRLAKRGRLSQRESHPLQCKWERWRDYFFAMFRWAFHASWKKRVQIIRTEISWDKCTDLILSYVSWACVIWQRPVHCEFTMVTFAMFRQQAPSLSQPARIYGQLDTTPASYRSLMGGGAYNGGSHGMEHTILPTR